MLLAAVLAGAGPAVAVERHWLVPLQISAAGETAGPPALAVNARGAAVVAWTRGSDAVLAATRPAAGAPWSAPVRLSETCQSPCVFGGPAVDMNDAGDIVVIWSAIPGSPPATTVRAAVRAAATDTWAAPRDLGTVATVAATLPNMDAGIDDAGRVVVAWFGGDGTVLAAARSEAGVWGEPERVAGPGAAASQLSLAVGGRGDAVATWIAACRPFAARRPSGTAWSAPLPIDVDEACGEHPAVAVDVAGNAVAGWRRWTGTDRAFRVAELPTSASAWQSAKDLGGAGSLGFYVNPPSIAVTRQGAAAALWRDSVEGLRIAVRPPEGLWSAAEPVPGLGRSLGDVAGTVGADGAVAVFQASFTNFPRAVVRESGGTWTGPFPLPQGPPQLPIGYAAAALRLDGSGDALLASLDPGRRVVHVTELTTREGARPDPNPAATVTALTGPAIVPAGAVARLKVTLDRPAEDLPLAIERRAGSGWTTIARHRVVDAATAELPVRLARSGATVLRVSWLQPTGTRGATASLAVRVTRPGRVRLPAGPTPRALAAGEGALWVLGEDGGEASVRRIDPATGRQAGRTIPIGWRPGAIAAGAGAVWVVRGGRSINEFADLVRIDPSGAVGEPHAAPGLVRSVAASGTSVWLGGVCLPQPAPIQLFFCDRRAAARVDAASGMLTTVRVVPRDGHADAVEVFGRTLWAWGEEVGNYDNTILARADSTTGRVSASTLFLGRFGVPLLPVSAGAVWRVDGQSIGTASPGAQRRLYSAGRYRQLTAAPAGRLVWVLERRALTRTLATSRLLALDARTGARVGPFIELGQSELQDQRLAVTRDAVWVLQPLEGTLMRVPIPPALR
jgi:hypothetical protein